MAHILFRMNAMMKVIWGSGMDARGLLYSYPEVWSKAPYLGFSDMAIN